MSAAHTPGPWAISDSAMEYNGELMIIAPEAGDNGVHVCEVTTDTKRGKHKITPEQLANARLMAASPKLLAALIRCEQRLKGNQHTPQFKADYEQVCAAIAQATGQTPPTTTKDQTATTI